ncbi:MAG: Abi family protein [Eubacteriales bacterium]|nr:Abi family protein [Clostridiales bacterium]MDY5835830.1 Abi family protein [Eubacteriales bacterium]
MEDFKPDKPYISEDVMLNRLADRGLEIEDIDRAKAILSSFSYYDLINGYKSIFAEDEKFVDGISIDFLYKFRMFDLNMQNMLFKYSVMSENRFKNIMAQNLAKYLGVHQNQYLNPFYFSYSKNEVEKFNKTIEDVKSVYTKSKRHFVIDQPTRHYVNNHNHVPPWILLKNTTFSTSIDLYNFLSRPIKDEITKNLLNLEDSIDNPFGIALKSLYTIRRFRNVIAHNLKFITFNLRTPQAIAKEELRPIFEGSLIDPSDTKSIGSGDPYSMALALVLILHEGFLVEQLFTDIKNLYQANMRLNEGIVRKYEEVSHIPQDIVSRGHKYMSKNNLLEKKQTEFIEFL